MNPLLSLIDDIVRRHAEWTESWHVAATEPSAEVPWKAVERNHRMNFDLWHAEDVARRDDLGAESVREAKRTIDRSNQARNDALEQLDVWLLGQLPPLNDRAPLHTETPGMIIDRLSILSLKLYHMRIEAERESAPEEQRRKCTDKLRILQEQFDDLRDSLKRFLGELEAGTRRFKLYRQLKMYNDPNLNPQLYTRQPAPR